MATSPVARRLNSTLDRLEATSPTAKLARSLAAPATVMIELNRLMLVVRYLTLLIHLD